MQVFDPEKTTHLLIEFLRDEFRLASFTTGVVGLSGGVDSATSCALLVRALGKANVHAVLLPYGELNTQGTNDALLAAQSCDLTKENIHILNIKPFVDPIFSTDSTIGDLRKGNIMARMRMIVLYDWSKKLPALVVGTENKSEHLLGYFTRFGDEASDIEPLRTLYKTQVYDVARCVGVPSTILTKAPTAGLWSGQTDESEFGFRYEEADEVMWQHLEMGKTSDEIVASGILKPIVDAVLKRVGKNKFKHELPKVFKTEK